MIGTINILLLAIAFIYIFFDAGIPCSIFIYVTVKDKRCESEKFMERNVFFFLYYCLSFSKIVNI